MYRCAQYITPKMVKVVLIVLLYIRFTLIYSLQAFATTSFNHSTYKKKLCLVLDFGKFLHKMSVSYVDLSNDLATGLC